MCSMEPESGVCRPGQPGSLGSRLHMSVNHCQDSTPAWQLDPVTWLQTHGAGSSPHSREAMPNNREWGQAMRLLHL